MFARPILQPFELHRYVELYPSKKANLDVEKTKKRRKSKKSLNDEKCHFYTYTKRENVKSFAPI